MAVIAPRKKSRRRVLPLSTDAQRWQAVVNRDPAADGAFVYAVRTTGVYCRPVCPSRLALRKNVRFYATSDEAEAAGFRPCKRCRPMAASLVQQHAAIVARACRLIENVKTSPSLAELASAVGMSASHLHRIFKAQTGVTPKRYAATWRTNRLHSELTQRPKKTITAAIYGAGFNSASRFYESSQELLGMTAKSFRTGGRGATIRFAVGRCQLGSILVAASKKGICAILLGDNPDELTRDLQQRFPEATLVAGDAAFEQLVAQVVGFVEAPAIGLHLPLDIRGTSFQRRVWEALRRIPAGTTTTYAEIAKRIGQPKSVRAVASAIAANALAVVIPCHRVIRTDGSLSGYRWGVERKRKLLRSER
jgi:AraC family transcriptional regulator of adaptative response/methylated-DNA-[protein]-cysteine methyltransferase